MSLVGIRDHQASNHLEGRANHSAHMCNKDDTLNSTIDGQTHLTDRASQHDLGHLACQHSSMVSNPSGDERNGYQGIDKNRPLELRRTQYTMNPSNVAQASHHHGSPPLSSPLFLPYIHVLLEIEAHHYQSLYPRYIIRPIRGVDTICLTRVWQREKEFGMMVHKESPALNLADLLVKTSSQIHPPGANRSNFFTRASNPKP